MLIIMRVAAICLVTAALCGNCIPASVSALDVRVCAEFHRPGECRSLRCGGCQYADELCSACLPCPTQPQLSMKLPAERQIFRCLYSIKMACNFSCWSEGAGTSQVPASSVMTTTKASKLAASAAISSSSVGISESAPPASSLTLIIGASVSAASLLLLCIAGLTVFLLKRQARKGGGGGSSGELSAFLSAALRGKQRQPFGVGVCTACDRIVEGTGISPDGAYCECT